MRVFVWVLDGQNPVVSGPRRADADVVDLGFRFDDALSAVTASTAAGRAATLVDWARGAADDFPTRRLMALWGSDVRPPSKFSARACAAVAATLNPSRLRPPPAPAPQFTFENASSWFGNMSLVVAEINRAAAAGGANVTARFATANEYFDALHADKQVRPGPAGIVKLGPTV
jgi:hypothetical protein